MDLITPAAIEAQARAAGYSINRLCREAGLARSVFTRWKSGINAPSVDAVNRLITVLSVSAPEQSA